MPIFAVSSIIECLGVCGLADSFSILVILRASLLAYQQTDDRNG